MVALILGGALLGQLATGTAETWNKTASETLAPTGTVTLTGQNTISGAGVVVDFHPANNQLHLQVGGAGSSLSGTADTLTVTDGATLKSNSRVLIGTGGNNGGDGKLIVKNGTLDLNYHLVVGDSRDGAGKGKGYAYFENSTLKTTSNGGLTVGYWGDGSFISKNSTLTINRALIIGETSTRPGSMTIQDTDLYVDRVIGLPEGKNGTNILNVVGQNTVRSKEFQINGTNTQFNLLMDSTGRLGTIASLNELDLKFNNVLHVGLAQYAGVGTTSLIDGVTIATANGAISGFSESSSNLFALNLSSDSKTLTAQLKPTVENAVAATGWTAFSEGSQEAIKVTMTLTGGDATAYQNLVNAMNAGVASELDNATFTLDGDKITYNTVTQYSGNGIAAWDFAKIAPNVKVSGVSMSAGEFTYTDMNNVTGTYNNWVASAKPTHMNPARLTAGATFSDAERVEVFGHSLYVTGEGTKFNANKADHSLYIGGTGSSFDSYADRLVVTDGANLYTKARLLVGYNGDGDLIVKDSTLTSDMHIVVGDSRNNIGKAAGYAMFDNSTISVKDVFTSAYQGKGEVLLKNGTNMTVGGQARIGEDLGSGILTVQNSTFTVNNELNVGHSGKSANNTLNLVGDVTVTAGKLGMRANSNVNILMDSTGELGTIKTTRGDAVDFMNRLNVGLSQNAGLFTNKESTIVSAGGAILNVSSDANDLFTLTLSADNKTLTAELNSAVENATGATGWKTVAGDCQAPVWVTMTLTGGDVATYQSLVDAMNAGIVKNLDNQYTFTLNGDQVTYDGFTNYRGDSVAVWDFSALASGVGVSGVTLADRDFTFKNIATDKTYSAWVAEANPTHENPALLNAGKTFNDANLVEVYGHSLYVTGAGTTFNANKNDQSVRIGGEGSSFDSYADRLVISDGATFTTKGRILVGYFGDGDLLVKDATVKVGNVLSVGDSREGGWGGKGRGNAVIDNSTVSINGTLTVANLADGEMLITNGSKVSSTANLNMSEGNSGYTSKLTIQEGSSLSINGDMRIAQNGASHAMINVNNGTLKGNKTEGGYFEIGMGGNSRGEVYVGNGSTLDLAGYPNLKVGRDNATGILEIVGGENAVKVGAMTVNSAKADTRVTFLADSTGFSTMNLTGNATLNGHVQAGLASGLVTLDASSFDLMTTTGGTINAGTLADTSVWKMSVSGDSKTLSATLNPTLELNGTALNKGWVELLPGEEFIDRENVIAQLELTGVSDVQSFADWLNTENYLGENANVDVTMTTAEVQDGKIVLKNIFNELGKMFLAFDFSGYDLNAQLQSVSFIGATQGPSSDGNVPEPTTWVLLAFGVLGIVGVRKWGTRHSCLM
ncbi:MAG: PEP-CTERM sorting domain-containing protein [Planctomycetia bacterium]|nr:PEP-CTERM sorting domain-containing protein [Planctomycetia bacterium]